MIDPFPAIVAMLVGSHISLGISIVRSEAAIKRVEKMLLWLMRELYSDVSDPQKKPKSNNVVSITSWKE